MDSEEEWVLGESEFAGYYGTRKIKPSEEVCFVKDVQKVQLLFFLIIVFHLNLSPSYGEIEKIPIPQTVVDRFREKTYLNHRYTRAEARKFLEELHIPIVRELKAELHELTRISLRNEYVQEMIKQHVLRKMTEEQILESAKNSILDNDRNIKSLILVASGQMDPFGRFKPKAPSGNLPPFLMLKNPLFLRVKRLELAVENFEERLADVEKLVLFQEDKINALRQDQETLISWIKLGGYLVTIFQIGKGTYILFLSPWGREKVREWKVVFFQKGEKLCLVLLEKFRVQ